MTKTHPKYGNYTITPSDVKRKSLVTFENTGYSYLEWTNYANARRVKDWLHPTVQGKGCIGDGPYRLTVKGEITDEGQLWESLLRRKGYDMPKEQLNLQNFVAILQKDPHYQDWKQAKAEKRREWNWDTNTQAFVGAHEPRAFLKIGGTYKSNNHGTFTILEKISSHKWLIQFEDGSTKEAYSSPIRTGNVRPTIQK